MTNSEMTEDKRGAKEKLAIASLVLAITTLFGVLPLALLNSNIYCMIVYRDCAFDYQVSKFIKSSCYPSAAASVLAIILGIISVRGAYTNSRIRLIGVSGIIIGFGYWPLLIATFFIIGIIGMVRSL